MWCVNILIAPMNFFINAVICTTVCYVTINSDFFLSFQIVAKCNCFWLMRLSSFHLLESCINKFIKYLSLPKHDCKKSTWYFKKMQDNLKICIDARKMSETFSHKKITTTTVAAVISCRPKMQIFVTVIIIIMEREFTFEVNEAYKCK